MHGQIVKGGWVGWGTRYPCPPTIKTYQINLIKNLELSQEAKPTYMILISHSKSLSLPQEKFHASSQCVVILEI